MDRHNIIESGMGEGRGGWCEGTGRGWERGGAGQAGVGLGGAGQAGAGLGGAGQAGAGLGGAGHHSNDISMVLQLGTTRAC